MDLPHSKPRSNPNRENAQKQIESLNKIRAERDSEEVDRRLEAVRLAAEAGENVMPSVIDAVEVYATVGEVCATLKAVYGEYQEPIL